MPFRHLRHLTATSSKPPTLTVYFSRARLIDSLRLHLFTSPSLPLPSLPSPLEPFTASHLIRCAPTPDSALSLFTSLTLQSPPPLPLLHSLASRLAVSGRLSALHSLLPSFPVPPSHLDRLRWFSLAGDLQSALSAWEYLRATSPRGHPCTESYNLIIQLYASNQKHSLAVLTFHRMVREDGDEEEDGESSDEEEVKNKKQDKLKGVKVKLKPWLDPIAIARALEGWDPREVAELEKAKIVWSPRLVCKLLRAFRKPESAWSFFCWVAYQPGGFFHDRHTVARMITILARHGKSDLVDQLLNKVRDEGITLPFSTVRLIIDFYGLSKQADAAIRVFHETEVICGPMPKSYQLLLYSSLLRTMVKCRRGHEAMLLLEEMMHRDILPDIQTFAGLIEYFARNGDLKSVHKLFGLMRQCGLKPDAYTYGILICAYCKNNIAMLAVRVFDEMLDAGLMPDKATKGLLVKSLWKEGKLREAAEVEERCDDVAADDWPESLPGHAWTVSVSDLKHVHQIYSGCFQKA
ncbi:tetratricopeptide repeat (TPR)-like superfamily protein isoform X2 [Carex rostrata]